jgi:uncharacterized phage protein gp47/JayE
MSLITPTTEAIYLNIVASLEASFNQTIPLLPKSFLRVLAKTLAGVYITLYKFGGYTHLQQFVKTATMDETVINGVLVSPLKFWGELVGLPEPDPATNAQLLLDVTVENQVGFLNQGEQLIGKTNGFTYINLATVALDAPTVQITVKAVDDEQDNGGKGVAGNLDAGQVVSFANPIDNVARDTTVNSQVVTAADAQTEASYRQAILDRFQKRPQGGAYADYELWGEEVEGIINVYPYTGLPGQVDVYSEATVASSGNADGIPTAAQLQAVYDSIQVDENGLASRRNANAFVNSLPITRTGFDVAVSGIDGVNDLAQVQADITTGITNYFLSVEPFIPGLSVLPRKDIATRTRISAIAEDIVTAAGGTFTGAEFFLEGTPTSLPLYVVGEGEKTKMSSILFN